MTCLIFPPSLLCSSSSSTMFFPLFLLCVALFNSDPLPSIFGQQYGTLITVCRIWESNFSCGPIWIIWLQQLCFWSRLWGRLGSWIFGSSFKRCWVRRITVWIPLVSMRSQCSRYSVLASQCPVLWSVCCILVWILLSVILCIHISLASCLVALLWSALWYFALCQSCIFDSFILPFGADITHPIM